MFEVIPVIDLLHGEVVHARRGDRANYQPIRSVLCKSAEPLMVLEALLALHPFDTFYVADLDAIQRQGNHEPVLRALRAAHPAIQFWVDAGISSLAQFEAFRQLDLGVPIIGAESLNTPLDLIPADADEWILSMDFRGDAFLGQPSLLRATGHWPERVLALNLIRVGSSEGPDAALIRRLAAQAPQCEIYAAGGIRTAKDFELAAEAGASGALVATALHDGMIGREALWARENPARDADGFPLSRP